MQHTSNLWFAAKYEREIIINESGDDKEGGKRENVRQGRHEVASQFGMGAARSRTRALFRRPRICPQLEEKKVRVEKRYVKPGYLSAELRLSSRWR